MRRRVGPLLEGYHVRAGALRDVPMHQIAESWLVPSAAPAAPTSQERCQAQGLCNVELRAGNSLPAGALWTGVIAAADMKFQQAWRLCRRGEALEIERPGPDWLAPAAGDLDRLGRLSMALDQIHITADQQPAAPPPCVDAKDAAARKTVVSERAPAPIMGIFLLRKEDAGAVDRLSAAKAASSRRKSSPSNTGSTPIVGATTLSIRRCSCWGNRRLP